MTDYAISERTRLRRRPQRGRYDRQAVHQILDAGLFCCVARVDAGRPVAIPTIYWRDGERVYWHGSAVGRSAACESDVCLTVALLDGLVLARSAFRHSVQYRSVVAFGRARQVVDPAEKQAALRAMIERLFPGRWQEIRPPSKAELDATAVARLDLNEVSAKVRIEGPADLESDLALPAWAGVIPIRLQPGAPVADAGTPPGVHPPAHHIRWGSSVEG